VEQPDGSFLLAGMNLNCDITYDGQTWDSGLGIGGGGIAYLGDGTFVTGGLLSDLKNNGLTFTTSDGTQAGELSLGDEIGTLYTGLQSNGFLGNIDIVYGANYSNTLDVFLLDMNDQEIVQQITFPELEDKAITDLQLFTHENDVYLAVSWTTPGQGGGGGVQVYEWNIPNPACPADVNLDGAVDLDDLNVVLTRFGQPGALGDTNGDGVVDLDDLNAVLTAFGTLCG
jgi:hypothetical protein